MSSIEANPSKQGNKLVDLSSGQVHHYDVVKIENELKCPQTFIIILYQRS